MIYNVVLILWYKLIQLYIYVYILFFRLHYYAFLILMDFPGISNSKESAYNAGDPGSIPGLARSPGEVLLPVDLHGYRSLVGYSPWGCKESDTTEQLTVH